MLKLLALAAATAAFAFAAPAAEARIQLGLADQPGGASTLRKVAPFGYRYQYLAGGVNTGSGWSTWNENGTFVTRYIDESRKAGITPVFTYYMIRQSRPGSEIGDEAKADLCNLRNASTMKAYWADLTLFFKRAGSTHRRARLSAERLGYQDRHRDPGSEPARGRSPREEGSRVLQVAAYAL